MRVMTEVLRPFLNSFVVIYFDDILISSNNKSEHLSHLRQVMEILQHGSFMLILKKCSFLTNNMVFLGFIVSGEGLKPDSKKINK